MGKVTFLYRGEGLYLADEKHWGDSYGDYYHAADYEALEAKLADKEKTVELHRKRADAYRNEALGAKFDRCAKVIEESIANGKYSQDNRVKIFEAKLAALVEAAKEVVRISDRKHDAWDKLKAAIAAAKVKP